MKKKEPDLIGYADERYINEADPARAVGTGMKKGRMKWVMTAVALLLLAALGLTVAVPLFKKGSGPVSGEFPEPEPSDAGGISYNEVYERLLAYRENNGVMDDVILEEEDPFYADGGQASPGYVEITDNQVSGVIEGDRIKRSDRYIYYLNGGFLYVYSIEGASSKLSGAYDIPVETGRWAGSDGGKLFLSEDCSRVTLFVPTYTASGGGDAKVTVLSLDVSNLKKITCLKKLTVSGTLSSVRLSNGMFLLCTRYTPKLDHMDYAVDESFMPLIRDGERVFTPANFFAPDVLNSATYTVLTTFNEKDFDWCRMSALLSYSADFYVGNGWIVAHREFTDHLATDEKTGALKRQTELRILHYTNGFGDFCPRGVVTIDGWLKDRYSLDIHNGILRAVTTTAERPYEITETGATHYPGGQAQISANLYCIGLDKTDVIGQVVGFAPQGETVRSVRFDGDTAYVCTAVVFTDPVFFFDLTDPKNITYKKTPEIEGFSSSLVNLKDGYLLGIGKSDGTTLKIEVFKEGQTQIESVAVFERESTRFSSSYHAYYIDRERGLVGLGYNNKNYLVLHFDGERLTMVLDEPLNGYSTN